MADKQTRPNVAALRKLEASLQQDLRQREAVMRAPQGRGVSHGGASHLDAPHIDDEAPRIPRVARSAANSNAANAAADNAIAGNVAAARRTAAAAGAAPAGRNASSRGAGASSRDALGGYYWRSNVLH